MNKHNLPTTTSTWFLTMTSRKTCSFCLVGDCSLGISELDFLSKWVSSPYSYYTILSLLTVKESVDITHTSYTWGTTEICFFEVRYTVCRHQTVHLKYFFFYLSVKKQFWELTATEMFRTKAWIQGLTLLLLVLLSVHIRYCRTQQKGKQKILCNKFGMTS